jgi:hypothetical protein
MRFIDFDKSKNEIRVVVVDFAYEALKTDSDKVTGQALEENIGGSKLSLFVMRQGDDDSVLCDDFISNDRNEYCKIKRPRNLPLRKNNYKWLPSMLEYYWQNGIGEKAMEFLECSNFVTEYRYVASKKQKDQGKKKKEKEKEKERRKVSNHAGKEL